MWPLYLNDNYKCGHCMWSPLYHTKCSYILPTYLSKGVHKNNYVSGVASRCVYQGQLGTSFFTFLFTFCFDILIFSHKRKKREKKANFAATRLATILATRWTGNRLFFMDSPMLQMKYYNKEHMWGRTNEIYLPWPSFLPEPVG